MEKPLIFISHITEEKELAILLKQMIESTFSGMIDVFVSSDENNIALGDKWLENISDSLKECKVELILCSPKSIKKPWINFEAGAGWIRDITVIPLCHSEMDPKNLPLPLNLLQGVKVSDPYHLESLFSTIARAIGSEVPSVDFNSFLDKTKVLESRYSFWDICNEAFGVINSINPEIINTLRKFTEVNIRLTESQINEVEAYKEFLERNKLLTLSKTGNGRTSGSGSFYEYNFGITARLICILFDKEFKY